MQLYIRDELASVFRPARELKGFQRISLQPAEVKTVEFAVTPDLLKMYNKDMKEVIESGTFRITVGSSSADARLRMVIEVK